MSVKKLHSVASVEKHLHDKMKVDVKVVGKNGLSCRREYGYNNHGESSEIQTFYHGSVPVLKIVISALHGEVYAIDKES